MPELKRDLVPGRWMIIRRKSGRLISSLTNQRVREDSSRFALEMSVYPPPEIIACRNGIPSFIDEPDWQNRLVSKTYRAFIKEKNLDKENDGLNEKGMGADESYRPCIEAEPCCLMSLPSRPQTCLV
ncbi:MAG: hypothetical protein CR981_00260 [Proteobacteria bacterium]|nr:MAG: hypothetical protein CR981_00260 [Pseudomonadota bacterium]PIE65065.1 MAG: hypothetical protein CSA26_05345 [Desulfobacterales bacterium]